MPPCEPVFQVIESGRNGENLEKLSEEATVLNVHYVIHIIGFHVTFNETWLAKVNLGRPPLYSHYVRGKIVTAIVEEKA